MDPKTEKLNTLDYIIFFDGICHLCSWFVQFVLARDKKGLFKFAPLQGTTAQSLLDPIAKNYLSSVVLFNSNTTYFCSEAVIRILSKLPWLGWTRILLFIPKRLRDFIYNFIAKNRYRWFGQREVCRLPQKGEEAFMLP